MQPACRLRKNKQFQYIYRRGKSCACRELVLFHVRNPRLQVGFSVSRKVGGSVIRNRVKRRLREQFRAVMPAIRPGLYVVVARNAAAAADSATLRASLEYLLRRQGLFLDRSQGDRPQGDRSARATSARLPADRPASPRPAPDRTPSGDCG